MLTWIICIPFGAALLTAVIPRNYRLLLRAIPLAATFLTMLLKEVNKRAILSQHPFEESLE